MSIEAAFTAGGTDGGSANGADPGIGKIIQVTGPVVDVEFSEGALPLCLRLLR